MQNPFEITINNQADDEKILRIWRRHYVTLVGPTLKVAAFALIPILLLVFTGFSIFSSVVLFVIFVIIVAMVLTVAAYEWVSWWGDVYVLTNYRIIDVQQDGFFNRRFTEASLDKLQDVNYETKGISQTVFHYGTVETQTAGAEAKLKLDQVHKPQDVALVILREQQKFLDDQDDSLSADELIALLGKHKKDLDNLAKAEAESKKEHADQQVKDIKEKVKNPKTPKKQKKKRIL